MTERQHIRVTVRSMTVYTASARIKPDRGVALSIWKDGSNQASTVHLTPDNAMALFGETFKLLQESTNDTDR